MSKNKDGLAKNIEVVKGEFRVWAEDQAWNIKRIRKGEDNLLHLGVALISTTYQALPRTMTYITLIVGAGFALRAIFNAL